MSFSGFDYKPQFGFLKSLFKTPFGALPKINVSKIMYRSVKAYSFQGWKQFAQICSLDMFFHMDLNLYFSAQQQDVEHFVQCALYSCAHALIPCLIVINVPTLAASLENNKLYYTIL